MVDTPKRLVILDTHAILHRAYHALPDLSSSKGEPTGALFGLVSMLTKIIADLKPDYIVAAFDLPKPTHRHIAYEDYKAHRVAADDALVAQIIRSRDVLDAFGIPRYECEGFEADDVIGTVVEKLKHARSTTTKKKEIDSADLVDVVIASGDNDLLQLVDDDHVRVFTFKKGLSDTVLYDEEKVIEKYGFGPALVPDLKGIMGDASDNIKGVPGVGEGSALKLVKTFGSVESIYEALKKKGVEEVAKEAGIQKRFAQLMLDHEEDAAFSKLLATIRLDAPINFVLPEKSWKDGVDRERLYALLTEFDFRSLITRVKALFGESGDVAGGSRSSSDGAGGDTPTTDGLFGPSEDVPSEELADALLAVWVLDSNTTQPTLEDVYRVGGVRTFVDARKNLLAQIKKDELSFVYEKIELPLRPILRQMEQMGIKVDHAFLRTLSGEYTGELHTIAKRIYAAAGEEFNINSPKQLGEVLFDKLGLGVKNQKKTAGGQRTTRESELEKMRDQHPIIADILAHRELQKLLSTYIDTIPTMLDERSRLHTSFIQTGTTTGRLSSQNPNLQNIPIKTDLGRAIRRAFVAEEGMRLVSFDYSQLELRIAAFLSGDEALSEIFKNGRDVHAEVAARVFDVRGEDVSYEQRRRAKVINFGILYGMGVSALREQLGTTRGEAQEFYDQYFAAFPRLAAYLEEVKADATRRGYTETYFGRRRYVAGINSPIPYVRAAAERMAINAPVQGTEADMLKLAMVDIAAWVAAENLGDRVRMLLQVHDELVFEVAEKEIASAAEKIRQVMQEVIPLIEAHNIPFLVEGKVGGIWGEMEKLV